MEKSDAKAQTSEQGMCATIFKYNETKERLKRRSKNEKRRKQMKTTLHQRSYAKPEQQAPSLLRSTARRSAARKLPGAS